MIASLLVLSGGGADWRQFRGTDTSGLAPEESLPPLGLDQGLAWKADLIGRGLSSPIVVGDRVFVTASSGRLNDRLHVLAYDTASGRKLWQRTLWATGPTMSHPKSCMAAPTPASDGRVVVALFGTDDLVCLDLEGNVRWVRCLYEENTGASDGRGLASSVLIVRDTAIVHIENQNVSFAAGVDLRTGRDRWRVDRPREYCWTSPLVLPGRTVADSFVLLQGSTRLSAYDPETGREVWGVTGHFQPIASSVFAGNRLYVPADKGLAAYELSSDQVPTLLWEKPKLNAETASPLVWDNRLYILHGSVLVCADARTGEVLGQLRLQGPFSSSPVLAGGLIYCVNENGLAQVCKPGEKEPTVVTRCRFEETILATPAIAGRALYLRSDRHLWKMGKNGTASLNGSAGRAQGSQVLQPKPSAGIRVWDTGASAEAPLTASQLARQDGWLPIQAPEQAANFQGDAVITNGRVLAVQRRRSQTLEVYSVGAAGAVERLKLRLLNPAGERVSRLERLALCENSRGAACLEVSYLTPQGAQLAARFRIRRGDVTLAVEPQAGAGRLRVECPGRFAVLPDFFADDIVIDASKTPLQTLEVPSENFLLHLTDQGNSIGICVFENRQQDVRLSLSGEGPKKLITGSDIPFEGKKIWVAALDGPQIWHGFDLKAEDAGKILSLGWKMPFAAQWRADLTRTDDLTDSWEMLLQEEKNGPYVKPSWLGSGDEHLDWTRRRWNTVLGTYPYPCWSDPEGRGYLQPLLKKPVQFGGPVVIYPINRVKQTPLDAYTVVDIMRNTLGVGPCEHILDLEGQKAEYKGRATCSCRDELGRIYAAKEQKKKHDEVEKILDDGLIFVKHIRGRITRYVEFGHKMRDYLAEQRKLHPELGDFLNEMDRIAGEIDARVAARADKIHTPAHVARMNEEFRKQVLDYEGDDALARCHKYSSALVEIGDNQDELSGECRWVVKTLRQRAGLRMALDPRVAPAATEIRARTQEVLRNPASHEGAHH
jgi:outer membrane protein assembly factor BamB